MIHNVFLRLMVFSLVGLEVGVDCRLDFLQSKSLKDPGARRLVAACTVRMVRLSIVLVRRLVRQFCSHRLRGEESGVGNFAAYSEIVL